MKYCRNFYEIKPNKEIFEQITKEAKFNPYYSLPFQSLDIINERVENTNAEYIFVIGIGGSNLGTKAIYDFISQGRDLDKQIYFLDTIDPTSIKNTLNNKDLTKAHFILISKSGYTVEPLCIYEYLKTLINFNSSNMTVITTNNSKLAHYALKKNYQVLYMPEDLSGRFSVFSVVGLFPLALCGINIEKLLKGCQKVYKSFFSQGIYYENIFKKARFFVENKSRFNINLVFSYSSSLESFNKWYIQLWAESLGKVNINGTRQSLTPQALLGPIDQHSFLQLIMDGVRDKTITFIKIEDFNSKISINNIDSMMEKIINKNISKKSFNQIINTQANATIQAIENEKNIPCDVITLPRNNEKSIAELMFSFQILVSVIGCFLQIDTYNQPGVEKGKDIFWGLLGGS